MLSTYDSLWANFFKREDYLSTFYPLACLPIYLWPIYPSICTHTLNIFVKYRFQLCSVFSLGIGWG